jgi:hypothetical protein
MAQNKSISSAMNRRLFMKAAGAGAAFLLIRCAAKSIAEGPSDAGNANAKPGNAKSVKEDQRPNILFCIMDDASWPHMSTYGCSWAKTPAFDRLAEKGILFRNAYTPNAKCAPSWASILTGRNSWQLEEAANHIFKFPAKFKTFPEVLRENGYMTGLTGIPNARVKVWSALVGAVFAAIFWTAAKYGFGIYVTKASYHSVYGILGLIPLAVLWIYIIWWVVLTGLQLTYATQHVHSL